MNSMHNSFGSGSGGGYSGPYPGYVPPSALPYYNGYPGELAASQTPGAYYGKPSTGMPGYSSGMAGYSAPNINNSMYYQQYGLQYQYGYGKYGLGAGLTTSLGYGSELGGPASIAPSSLGGLQAPTTDLGLTGSMFSKGSSSGSIGSSNKYSNLGNSSPHSIASSQPNSVISAVTPTPPSASPHSLPNALRGHGATPSPPVDPADGKKDLDKMRRCQLCGQVFRLMSECLAHMKAVHEAPMSMYGMPHSSHTSQSMVPPHLQTHGPSRSTAMSTAPDSPLMALERMGWGKDQGLMPSLHSSSSPISQPYPSPASAQAHQAQSMSSHQINMVSNPHLSDPRLSDPRLSDPRYGDPSQQSAKRLNDFYNSCNTNSNMNHEQSLSAMDSLHHHHPSSTSSGLKSRKSSSYSVSSIIGENSDTRRERRELMERGVSGEPPQTHSPSLPPSLTPNLPVTSTPSLPPNLSPNLPAQLQQTLPSTHNLSSQPPQLTPNIPSSSQPMNLNSSTHMNQQPPTLSPSYSTHSHATPVQSPNSVSSTSAMYHPPTTQPKPDIQKPDLTNNTQSTPQYYSNVNYGETTQSRIERLQQNSHSGTTVQRMPNDSNNEIDQHYQQYNQQQEIQVQHNHQIPSQPHKDDKKLDELSNSEQNVNLNYQNRDLMSQHMQNKQEAMSQQNYPSQKFAPETGQQNSPAQEASQLQEAQYNHGLDKSSMETHPVQQLQQYHEQSVEQSPKDSLQENLNPIDSQHQQEATPSKHMEIQHDQRPLSQQEELHDQGNVQQEDSVENQCQPQQADGDHQAREPESTNQSVQESQIGEVKDFSKFSESEQFQNQYNVEQTQQQTPSMDGINLTQKLSQEGPVDGMKKDMQNSPFQPEQSLTQPQPEQESRMETTDATPTEDEDDKTPAIQMKEPCQDSSQQEKEEFPVCSRNEAANESNSTMSDQLQNASTDKGNCPQMSDHDRQYQQENICATNTSEQNTAQDLTHCNEQVIQLNDNQEINLSGVDEESQKVEDVQSVMGSDTESQSNSGNLDQRDGVESAGNTYSDDTKECNETSNDHSKDEVDLRQDVAYDTKQESTEDHAELSPVEQIQEEQSYPSALDEDIGDEDEPGDPTHSILESEMSPNSNSQPTSWSGSTAETQPPIQGQQAQQCTVESPVQSPQQVPQHHSEQSSGAHPSEHSSGMHPSEHSSGMHPSDQSRGRYPSEQCSGPYSSEQSSGTYPSDQSSSTHSSEQPSAMHPSEQPSAMHSSEQPSVMHSSEQPSAMHSSEQPSAMHSSEQPSAMHSSEQPSAMHSSEQLSAMHSSEQPSAMHPSEQPSAMHPSEQPSAMHSSEQPRAMHSSEQPSAMHSSEQPSAMHSSEQPSAMHSSEQLSAMHSSEQPSAMHSSEQPRAMHSSEQPSAMHSSEQPSAMHSSEQPSAMHSSEQSSAMHSSEQSSAMHSSEQPSPMQSSEQPSAMSPSEQPCSPTNSEPENDPHQSEQPIAQQNSEQSSMQLNSEQQSAQQHSEQVSASHQSEVSGTHHHLEQPSNHPSQYYQQKQNHQSTEYADKASMPVQQSPQKSQQPGPYRGSWPSGYPNSSSSSSYQYHQYGGQSCGPNPAMMAQQAGGSKMPSYAPHSRYPNQYPTTGYDGRRPMPNPYPAQGHWYPAAPGRGDTKPPWTGWASSQAHGYPQSYFYGGSNAASSSQHIQQQQQQQHTSPQHKYPPHQTSPLPTTPPKAAKENIVSPPQSTPPAPPESPLKLDDSEVLSTMDDIKPETTPESLKRSISKISPTDKPRSKRNRPGPKSRVDRKMKDANGIQAPPSLPQQNGTVNPPAISPPAIAASVESSDSSDNEVDDEPRLAVLKPAKRFRGPDGSFVGPKRVKLAKMVRQRQHTRQKLIQDQIKQSELEEQLTQQWVDRASEQEGPLANVLLKSSLLLGDQNVEESDVMEECIASMTAHLLPVQASSEQDSFSGKDKPQASSNGTLMGIKKPGRKSYPSKVLHNNNSVIIKTHAKQKFVPKLRAKDFKWSHYIKSMRFWCKDCGHGFKNQKESSQHGEEQCKFNCLYMIECYVSVTDIVQHKLYGNKVEELLEEYQVDGEHKCGRCGTMVSRKADYLVHVDTHKDFMPWECTICGTRFKIRGSLKEHLRYTHMKGRVPCLKCNKVFATSTLLRQHVKVHTQHYKYNRTGKHREEDLRVARETEEDLDENGTPSDQLSHEANEYRNWCKLMELNAMKNIATSDMVEGNADALGELSGGEEGGLLNTMDPVTPTATS